MRLIPSFLSSINLFQPHSIEDDIALAAKIAKEDIAQSEATIMRAAYVKHMAEAKLKAHAEWRQLYKGNTNGHRTR